MNTLISDVIAWQFDKPTYGVFAQLGTIDAIRTHYPDAARAVHVLLTDMPSAPFRKQVAIARLRLGEIAARNLAEVGVLSSRLADEFLSAIPLFRVASDA